MDDPVDETMSEAAAVGAIELPEGERVMIRAATVSGGIGALGSGVISAAVADDSGRAFFVGATVGWVVSAAAGYLYTQWRLRKAVGELVGNVFDEPELADPPPKDGAELMPGELPRDPAMVYYSVTADPVPEGELNFPMASSWWVATWPTAYYGTAPHAIFIGALRAEWSALLSVPAHGPLMYVAGTGGWLQEWSVLRHKTPKAHPSDPDSWHWVWHSNVGRRWRLGGPEPPPILPPASP